MQDLLYSDRQHSWELTKPDVLAMCSRFPGGYAPSSNGPVDVSKACATLATWNGRDTLDARGALVFRRFWSRVTAVNAPVLGNPQRTPIWTTPFDVNDPVRTPRGLNTVNPLVLRAFGDAVADLNAAHIPVDGRLGDYQKDVRPDGTSIPIHGGPGTLGVFNALNTKWTAGKGYIDVPHGSSFVQTVQLTKGCPRSYSILTYSQSTNPASPYFSDQTRQFSAKRWNPMRFCASQLRKDPKLRIQRLRGPR
jgi:acyl-homoserine-lactone acylase